MDQAYRATGDRGYKLPARCWKKLRAVREKSYVPIVPERLGVFTGEHQFSLDELEIVASNRYAIQCNFNKCKYIRRLEGSSFEDLHDPSKAAIVRRCPWWRSHIGDFPSHRRHLSTAQRKRKRKNSLWWYGGEIHGLCGPVINAGWSADALSFQVEVPCPRFIRTVEATDGTRWTYDGEEGTEKGTMWITVAVRGTVGETSHLKFEK